MNSSDAEPAARRAPLPSLSSSSSFQIRAPLSFCSSSGSGSEIELDSDAGSGSGSESEPESSPDDAVPVPVPVAGKTPRPALDRLGSMPVARLTNDYETEEEEVFDDVDGDVFVVRVPVPVLDEDVRPSPKSSSEDEVFDEVDGDGFSTTARVSSQGGSSFATSPDPSLAFDYGDEAKLSEAPELEGSTWVADVVFGGNEGFESEADGGGDNGDRGDELNAKDGILGGGFEETSSIVEESEDLKSMEVEFDGVEIENGVANEAFQNREEEGNAVQAEEIGDQNPYLDESLDIASVLGNSPNVAEYSESSEEEAFDEVDGDGFRVSSHDGSGDVSPRPSLVADGVLGDSEGSSVADGVLGVSPNLNDAHESEAGSSGYNGVHDYEPDEEDEVLGSGFEETSSIVKDSAGSKPMKVESDEIKMEKGGAHKDFIQGQVEYGVVQAVDAALVPNAEENDGEDVVLGNSPNVAEYSESSEEEAFDEVDGDGFRVSSHDGSANVSPRPSLVADGVFGDSEGSSVADGVLGGSPNLNEANESEAGSSGDNGDHDYEPNEEDEILGHGFEETSSIVEDSERYKPMEVESDKIKMEKGGAHKYFIHGQVEYSAVQAVDAVLAPNAEENDGEDGRLGKDLNPESPIKDGILSEDIRIDEAARNNVSDSMDGTDEENDEDEMLVSGLEQTSTIDEGEMASKLIEVKSPIVEREMHDVKEDSKHKELESRADESNKFDSFPTNSDQNNKLDDEDASVVVEFGNSKVSTSILDEGSVSEASKTVSRVSTSLVSSDIGENSAGNLDALHEAQTSPVDDEKAVNKIEQNSISEAKPNESDHESAGNADFLGDNFKAIDAEKDIGDRYAAEGGENLGEKGQQQRGHIDEAGISGDNGDHGYEPNEEDEILGSGFEETSSIVEDSEGFKPMDVETDKIKTEKGGAHKNVIQGQVEYRVGQAVDAVLAPNAEENDGEDGLLGEDLNPENPIKDGILLEDLRIDEAAGNNVSDSMDGTDEDNDDDEMLVSGLEQTNTIDGGEMASKPIEVESPIVERDRHDIKEDSKRTELESRANESNKFDSFPTDSDQNKLDDEDASVVVEFGNSKVSTRILDEGNDSEASKTVSRVSTSQVYSDRCENSAGNLDALHEAQTSPIVDEKAVNKIEQNSISEAKPNESDHESAGNADFLEDNFKAIDAEKVIEGSYAAEGGENMGEKGEQQRGHIDEQQIATKRDYEHSISEEIVRDEEGRDLLHSDALLELLGAHTASYSSSGNNTITASDSTSILPANSPDISTTSNLAVASNPEKAIAGKEKKFHEKVELIRVKFLRIINRLGCSPSDNVAASVLYHLASIEDMNHGMLHLEGARNKALELEREEKEELDFSCNILIIGKSGMGKSATINSIFEEEKSLTNPFRPETTSVRKIEGLVDGINIQVLDTPGLKPSLLDQASNRKVLSSVKKHMKKCPPDVVLYMDRLDTQTQDFNDLPLLRSITSTLGSSIWSSAIIVLSHAATEPPEGPSGLALSYESYVDQRSLAVQQSIRQAAGDTTLMNPVVLVENHPSCRRDGGGQRVLPNGSRWRSELLLLCCSSKILTESNSLSEAQESSVQKLFKSPPLHFFVASLLESKPHPTHQVSLLGLITIAIFVFRRIWPGRFSSGQRDVFIAP